MNIRHRSLAVVAALAALMALAAPPVAAADPPDIVTVCDRGTSATMVLDPSCVAPTAGFGQDAVSVPDFWLDESLWLDGVPPVTEVDCATSGAIQPASPEEWPASARCFDWANPRPAEWPTAPKYSAAEVNQLVADFVAGLEVLGEHMPEEIADMAAAYRADLEAAAVPSADPWVSFSSCPASGGLQLRVRQNWPGGSAEAVSTVVSPRFASSVDPSLVTFEGRPDSEVWGLYNGALVFSGVSMAAFPPQWSSGGTGIPSDPAIADAEMQAFQRATFEEGLIVAQAYDGYVWSTEANGAEGLWLARDVVWDEAAQGWRLATGTVVRGALSAAGNYSNVAGAAAVDGYGSGWQLWDSDDGYGEVIPVPGYVQAPAYTVQICPVPARIVADPVPVPDGPTVPEVPVDTPKSTG